MRKSLLAFSLALLGPLAFAFTLSGTVYEDTVGAANPADFVPRPEVKVRAYEDVNGNGVLDSEDLFLGETTTDADGHYSFTLTVPKVIVIVDSRSVSPRAEFNSGFGQGDVWAEQTYGPDPASSTLALGPRYGGADPRASDGFHPTDTSPAANAGAKHRAWLDTGLGADISEVDFAFSFNVVTNLRGGGAEDDDPNANRTVQGSLRQFLQNANAIAGPNAMRFVPASPYSPNTSGSGGSWWTLSLTNPLPPLTDGGTVVAGTAYDALSPGAPRDTNPGFLGTGGAVGVDGLPLPTVPRPELALDLSGQPSTPGTMGLWLQGPNQVVRNLAIYGQRGNQTGGQAALYVAPDVGASGPALLEKLVVGALPDGTDPGPTRQNRRYGVRLDGVATVRGSFFAYNGYGLLVYGQYAQGSLIEGNEFAYNGPNSTTTSEDAADGDTVAFWNLSSTAWTATTTFRGNLVRDVHQVSGGGAGTDLGKGLELWYSGTQNVLIENNTILRARTAGVGIHAGAQGNTLRKNVIQDTLGYAGLGGAGVHLSVTGGAPVANRITQNHFGNNQGLAIDLDDSDWYVGDGVTPNNDNCNDSTRPNRGLDFPVIARAQVVGANLLVEGTACPGVRVEVYKAQAGTGDSSGGQNYGEGVEYLGAGTADASGNFSFQVPKGSLAPGDAVTALAMDASGNTSEFSANRQVLFGYSLSGRVYHDREPDGARGPSEDWSDGVAVYVKLIQGSAVVAVQAVAPGAGTYTFTGVAPGSYTLVLDDNSDLGDTAPTPPSGWLFVNPGSGTLSVSVGSADLAGLDFGLFHGALVQGRVFYDDGEGGGAANDALQNGAERGVPGVLVTATDGTSTRSALTDGLGAYRLYLPYTWGSVALSHPLRPATGYNDGVAATRVNDFAGATSPTSPGAQVSLGPASALAGQTLVRNFGVVRESRFYPSQSGQTASPGTLVYAHLFRPGTLGMAELRLENAPLFGYWARVDLNCDGTFGPGEDFAPLPLSFAVGSTWPREADGSLRACGVEVRVLVPPGLPAGALDVALVGARLAWSGSPVLEALSLTDTTQVSGQEVRLTKSVRNVTQGTPFGTLGEGRPGDVLEYCVAYRNLGTLPVSQFVLTDPVPFFADPLLSVADYGDQAIRFTTPAGTLYLTADADADAGEIASSLVRVRVGTLGPGESGEVCYRVQIR
ncbi:right-handed parallel beta-helix repeat-containing protein [Thermus sp.]|uniref:right-handed parallel beta-helix repeat-containing protein n=1 Tax=Thermus sp. TaxID=275 RepID=UPI003D0CA453